MDTHDIAPNPARVLRLPEVQRVTGMSGTTIWRETHAGRFPLPLRLSPNCIGWPEAEIAAWVASRPRTNEVPKPSPNRRPRPRSGAKSKQRKVA